MGLRMQPRNEKFFTLFSKAGSNVVESAALLMEFVAAPHGRWAVLANACTTPSTPATTPLNSDLTGSIHAVRSTIANAVGSSDTNRAHDSRPSQSADNVPRRAVCLWRPGRADSAWQSFPDGTDILWLLAHVAGWGIGEGAGGPSEVPAPRVTHNDHVAKEADVHASGLSLRARQPRETSRSSWSFRPR